MATTIVSNPTRFGAGATGPAGSVRFAFFNEGYTRTGSELPGDPVPNPPLNLFAFREGGGIVLASGTTFDAIGAGTVGDPLRLSQFSGFTVPPLSIYTTTLTEGDYVDGGYRKLGYARDAETLFPAIGSVSNATINGSSQFVEFAWRTVPFKSGSINTLNFVVTGDQTSSGWTTLSYNGYSFDLPSSYTGYDSGTNKSSWFLSGGSAQFTGAGTARTFTIT